MWRIQTTANAVRFWATVQLGTIIVLLLSVAVLGYFSLETHDSLCKFKHDLEQRRDSTALFISEIESGKRQPIPGISVADLQRSLAAQSATLDSLDDLHC